MNILKADADTDKSCGMILGISGGVSQMSTLKQLQCQGHQQTIPA
jgi:hypothetical protein